MCVPGDTNNTFQSHAGATAKTEMVERLEVYIVLDAKPDVIGRAAADQIHTVRLDILKCLHGWNPQRAAACQTPPIEYGYCTLHSIFTGDTFFHFDR